MRPGAYKQLESLGKPYRLVGLLFCWAMLTIAAWPGSIRAIDMEAKKSQANTLGGPCEYKAYKGAATIISVAKKQRGTGHGGPAYDRYEVKFGFSSDEKIPEAQGWLEETEHVLLLTNSWYPGPKFLEKYGISEGKVFDCYLKVITKGTCTPIVFDFPTVDLSDYFEFQS